MLQAFNQEWRTPCHLIDLYQNFLGKGKAEASGLEAGNHQADVQNETAWSQQVPMEPSSNVPPLMVEDYMDTRTQSSNSLRTIRLETYARMLNLHLRILIYDLVHLCCNKY